MKYLSAVVLIVMITACTENKGAEPMANDQITKKEVHKTLQKWAQAMLDNRLEPQQEILDDSWVYSGSDDGTTTTKKKALEGFKPGETTLKAITLQDTTVRIYSDVAIVTGKEELLFIEENDTTRVHLRFTDVFMKKDGKVTALSTHSSPIATNKSQN